MRTQIGSGIGAVNNLDSGQKAKADAVDFVTALNAKCVLKDVQRYAS